MTKKVCMYGVIQKPSMSLNHHNGGYTMIRESQLRDLGYKVVNDPEEADVLCITEGVNFQTGKYNVFGGVRGEHIDRLEFLENLELITLDENVPNYYDFIQKKKLERFGFKIPLIKKIEYKSERNALVLGDSHALSIYRPGFNFRHINGKTLHGILKIGIKNYIEENNLLDLTKQGSLYLYFGNIDLRHHLLRYPLIDTQSLMFNYADQIKEIENMGIQVAVFTPLPIESESRKLPKTGQYKGTNFYGTFKERFERRRTMILHLERRLIDLNSDCAIIRWDELPLVENEEMQSLSFEAMEAGSSVHLRPKFYKYINDILNYE